MPFPFHSAQSPPMARPIRLAFSVLLAWLAHAAAAYFVPLGEYAQTAVLIGNTVYVYGGAQLSNVGLTKLYTLDLSVSWSTSSPAWTDHTSDAGTVSVPVTSFGTMFPAYNLQSFYIWGGGNGLSVNIANSGFAQYTLATKQWSLPTTITNMPIQRRETNAVVSSSGVAYIWGGYGDSYTAYASGDKIYSDMIAFDTVQLTWNILTVSGTVPSPRILHTSTMLSNNKMVIIGGLIGVQTNATFVTLSYASMTDIPVFDTTTTTWTANNATGNLPANRRASTAVLAQDGTTIIVFGGGTQSDTVNLNDVAVLDTTSMLWSQPAVSGVAPTARMDSSSVLANGQMIILFGLESSSTSVADVGVLDTRQTPYTWATSFVSNSTLATITSTNTATATSTGGISSATSSSNSSVAASSSDNLSAIGGTGGIAGIAVGGVVVVAVIVFIALRKPWQKRSHSEIPQIPDQPMGGPPPPPNAQYYNPAIGQPYFKDSFATVDIQPQPQYNYSNPQQTMQQPVQPQYNYSIPQQPVQYIGQPGYGNPYPQYGPPGQVVYAPMSPTGVPPSPQNAKPPPHTINVAVVSKPELPSYPQTFKPDED